ncbi:short-chain dehydrogenase protein [Rhizobium sp. Kim5]|nr:short-chain dehydrogenase protein [Rhizobium sp. Kim5]
MEEDMDLGLKGKIAVITGASVGIGLAIAEGLAAEGSNLVLAARGGERLEAEAARIAGKYGVSATAVAADVATVAGTEAIIAAAAEKGGADILINNAGTGSNETVMEAPDEKWQAYWDLHVMAAVRLARGIAPQMKRRGGGVILHNASICAVQPLWYEPIYNVSKSALMMFSKTLSTELIPDNIRVNCVNAGLILTPDWIKTAKQLTAESGGNW